MENIKYSPRLLHIYHPKSNGYITFENISKTYFQEINFKFKTPIKFAILYHNIPKI